MKKKWRSLSDSAHYQRNKFLNLSATPVMAEGVSFSKLLFDYIRRPSSITPSHALPSVQTDLRALPGDAPVIVWFGHSSYLLHYRDTNILVDPVFSGHASPLPGMIKAFAGTGTYGVTDMPPLDYLLLSHNHYDHLDKKTIAALQPHTGACYVPLGVGRDIGSPAATDLRITEMDWWETVQLPPDMQLTATPARHFSGRGLRRATSLWASYVLQMPGYTIFIGGDSGYDTHFRDIGEKYGPFDLAILECGQYNASWPYIHMFPEQTLQAAEDLQAKALLPVHWGKFALANHPWNEPIRRLTSAASGSGITVTTPLIGEPVVLGHSYPQQQWWEF
ncbi:MBL fold metallo-hydrolase [Chitinophaga japonensis]|nr:MBL fold metallo-hydrolase [Chitinophaga japonensis]